MAGRNTKKGVDLSAIPSVTYCEPQVASFGYTEKKLKDEKIAYKKLSFPFVGVGKAVASGQAEGMVKILSLIHIFPFGEADIKREGKDISLIVHAKPLHMVLKAAEQLEKLGVDAEVVDLRSIRPLDEKAIYDSVKKTNRAVVIDESWPFASVGSHVAWLISRNCFDLLDAPVELVSSEDVPMPYNHKLELARCV